MIRFLDIIFSLLGLIILSPLILVLLIVGWLDTGSPVFWQKRIGRNKTPFLLFKFRTMYPNTHQVSTHLIDPNSVTQWGSFLRKSKLDETLQLFNVLKGDMSFVGPRPNLFNQEELIIERELRGVYKVRPGITGLAQVNKIDMSTPRLLAETDEKMIAHYCLSNYLKFILLTVFGKGSGDRIKIP